MNEVMVGSLHAVRRRGGDWDAGWRSAGRVARMIVVVLSAAAVFPACASSWTNLLGGAWSEAFNWSDHVVPAGADAVIALPGSYSVTNSSDVALANFRFEAPGATLLGPGRLLISNLFTWKAGQLGGPIAARVESRGGLLLAGAGGADARKLGRVLVNAGVATWSDSATLVLASGAVISNLAGATFDLTVDGTMNDSGAAAGFVNEGVFRKRGGTGTALFTPAFSNAGTVEAETGTLRLAGGGIHRGTFRLEAGAGLNLDGTHAFAANSIVSGPGELRVSSGTANFAGLVDVSGDHVFTGGTANFTGRYVAISNLIAIVGGVANFSGTGLASPTSLTISNLGVLGGTTTVTVRGPMRWGNGTIRGSGAVVAHGGLEIVGNAVSLEKRTLVNAGLATWGGPGAGFLTLSSGAVISNLAGATFDLTFDGTMNDAGAAGGFVNEGVFRKRGGTGTAVFAPAFRNSGRLEIRSGTFRLAGGLTQTAGNLVLAGGNLASAQPIRILGGRVNGAGRIVGTVANAGWIQPGDGIAPLVFEGAYSQDPVGSLEVRLLPERYGASPDLLVVSNTAILGGTLAVTLEEGFEPAPNARFEILRCNGRTGVFDDFRYPTNEVGLDLDYSTSNVVVRIVNTRPKLDPIPDQELASGVSLTVRVQATDADVPAQYLSYSLTNSPAGATIDSAGVLRWTPAVPEVGSITNFTVAVTDSGSPPLRATRTFSVRIGPGPELRALSIQAGVPSAGACTLVLRGVPGIEYGAEYSRVISGPWIEFATATADAYGIWRAVDPHATNAVRFYRVQKATGSL